MTDHYPELADTIEKFIKIIDKYRNDKDITIEVQLGINDEDDGFITGFNCEEFYQKVYTSLKSFDKWDSIKRLQYYNVYKNDFVYKITNIDKEEYEVNKIIESYIFNYTTTPYDFKIIVLKSTTTIGQLMPDDIYYKYNCTNFTLAQNKIQLYIEEKNDNEIFEINHGVNFSFVNLQTSNYSSKYLAHDILLKLRDIVNICENIEKAVIVPSQ